MVVKVLEVGGIEVEEGVGGEVVENGGVEEGKDDRWGDEYWNRRDGEWNGEDGGDRD